MNKGLTVLLLLVLMVLVDCSRGRTPEQLTREFASNEYDVVSAYVTGMFASHKGKQQASRIVILSTTSSGDDDLLRDENGQHVPWEKTAQNLREKAPSLQQATIDSFRRANARETVLGRTFRFPVEYEIVDSARLQSIFKSGDGWSVFYQQYPGAQGIATISRVGFSADGTQALFYAGNRCGGLCGSGSYVVMEKRDGLWLASKEIEMWVS